MRLIHPADRVASERKPITSSYDLEGSSLNATLRLLIKKELIYGSEIKECTQVGEFQCGLPQPRGGKALRGSCGKQESQSLTAEAGEWQMVGPALEVHRKRQPCHWLPRIDLIN